MDRAQLEALTAQFLAGGNEIEQVRPSVCSRTVGASARDEALAEALKECAARGLTKCKAMTEVGIGFVTLKRLVKKYRLKFPRQKYDRDRPRYDAEADRPVVETLRAEAAKGATRTQAAKAAGGIGWQRLKRLEQQHNIQFNNH